eukprot:jgi/Chrzof1/7651/Cz02g31190.t1
MLSYAPRTLLLKGVCALSQCVRLLNTTSSLTAQNTRAADKTTPESSGHAPYEGGAYTPVTKQLWAQRLSWEQTVEQPAVSATDTTNATAATQGADASMTPRPPKKFTVTYPFTTDHTLHEMYRNPWGYLRIGRLLEDLDSLAGTVAFTHCHITGHPSPLLVTASVDAIHLAQRIRLSSDVMLSGQVVWTGRSALDIRVELCQEPHAPEPSLVALFSFVSLDPATKRATAVPALQPTTPEEETWFRTRQEVADARKAARQAQKDKQTKSKC